MKRILKRMEGWLLAMALLVTSLPMNALDVQAAEIGGRGVSPRSMRQKPTMPRPAQRSRMRKMSRRRTRRM